ncbi:glycosyltransferase [Cytobacillus oceanisediminis]|uniref:glycosyltransferase family 2 protein n=1 Tax=Cytobacillus oceanisediminis TaxID=665099 RepID=UPI0023DADF14|nr:glycosyltransferase [Cytobacillus oceanisediminis]MDF2037694.1 glycosyltransferase [Cytobacillus oceanisediminis]
MKFCFVILHYRTLIETKECLQYLKKLDNQNDIQIIVVDNGSKDGSLKVLADNMKEESNILFVEAEYNVGFAKGNNLGYTIAKYKYQAEYIVMMNSDVFIQQKEFIRLIEEIYGQTNFDILGPDIITKTGEHQNPLMLVHDNIGRINKTIFLNRIRSIATFLPFDLKRLFKNPKKSNANIKVQPNPDLGRVQFENCPLHGACLIFSGNFVSLHEFPFYPDTFLYGEEDILYYLGQREKEKFVYSPLVEVLHMEDAATNICFSDYKKKKRFITKHSSKSLKVLKELMKRSK